eukprot:816585-Prorocentrum_minimum.AAC.1
MSHLRGSGAWVWQALLSLPVICFGFTSHVVLLPTMRNMHNPTPARQRLAVRISLLISGATYAAVGACGYLAFRCVIIIIRPWSCAARRLPRLP